MVVIIEHLFGYEYCKIYIAVCVILVHGFDT